MKKFTFALLAFALLLSVPALAASAADYSDVARTDWYYDAVDYAVSNALFSGTSKTAFSPALPMTRGMFVTVLCGYAGAAGHAAGTAAVTETINLRAGPTTDSAVVTVAPRAFSARPTCAASIGRYARNGPLHSTCNTGASTAPSRSAGRDSFRCPSNSEGCSTCTVGRASARSATSSSPFTRL